MVSLFVLAVIGSLLTAAVCSLVEAAIYSVPIAYAKHLAEEGSRSGALLVQFKEDIAKPISLILMLNTLAVSLGPMLTGWLLAEMTNDDPMSMGLFSIIFALVILILGELMPKTLGAVYCREVSRASAVPMSFLVKIFAPLLKVSEKLQKFLTRNAEEPSVSPHEVASMAEMGTEQGTLDHFEGEVISNVIGLDQILVRDILTPRVVVVRLKDTTAVGEIEAELENWQFSRIPLFEEQDPDHLTTYVTQRDIYRELLRGNRAVKLKELARRLETVPELMTVDKLLLQMFEHKEHICAVVDEHGGLAGIVTLEDVLEEVLGREIVDEYDAVSDLRAFAKIMRLTKRKNRPAR